MGKHRKKPTQEQIDFRNRVLRRSINQLNKKYPFSPNLIQEDLIKQQFYYIDNCIFWINEFINGRVSKDNLLSTADSLIIAGNNLKNILNNPTPAGKEQDKQQ